VAAGDGGQRGAEGQQRAAPDQDGHGEQPEPALGADADHRDAVDQQDHLLQDQ
jgi:hypothetical protein